MSLLDATLKSIQPQDRDWRERATSRLECLTMPHWSLGRLMDLAVDLAGMTRSMNPAVARRAIVTMAADHGVVAESVSKFPQEVTVQMVENFVRGRAGINALARTVGADVVVANLGVAGDLRSLTSSGKVLDKRIAPGTANMANGPAMSREQAVAAVEAGIEIAQSLGERIDLFGTGEMGIGNTTPSTAIAAVFTDLPVDILAGRGTGIDDEQLATKIRVIEQSLRVNEPDQTDGLDVLAKVGGFEIGGITGLILGAAAQHKPVIVDGFISTAGALVAQSLSPHSVDYMIAAHRSVEPGHEAMQSTLGKSPLLDLGLRLGEGTAAALAMNLAEAAVRILTEVTTFEEAQVSEAKF